MSKATQAAAASAAEPKATAKDEKALSERMEADRIQAEEDAAAAAAAAVDSDALPEGCIWMSKGGERMPIHVTCADAHRAIGWVGKGD